jgi:hypothetical protein
MSTKRLFAVAICAATVMSVGATAAFAGEVTGSGKNSNQNQGRSWCSFSGLNDDPLGLDPANGPGGRSQSYGQEVRLGLVSPHELNPGVACNPNRTFLPPNPNRRKK